MAWLLPILLPLAAFAPDEMACSCSNGGPQHALRSASAVYIGRVVRADPVYPGVLRDYQPTYLEVRRAIKGVVESDTVVVESLVGTGCEMALIPGGEYLVYAMPNREGGMRPISNYCTGTKPIACAARDLHVLGIRGWPGARADCRVSAIGNSSDRSRREQPGR